MNTSPKPPFLLVKEAVAVGVENWPVEEMSATPQGFAEGSFRDAFCYDQTGTLWPKQSATLKRAPQLLRVLDSESAFSEWLSQRASLDEVRKSFEACAIPEDTIRVARRLEN